MKLRLIMLDYPSLEAVAAVVREGSFERGAAALKITPSAISQRVRGLEDRLGAILIVRGQPCEATPLGQTLCTHLEQVRLLEHDLAPALGQSARDENKPISVGVAVNPDSLATWFPAAAASFSKRGGISLELMLDDEAYTADRLRAGEVMAAVTADPEPVQGCKTTPLGALRYIACASPEFAAKHFPEGMTKKAVTGAPYLRFDRRDQLQARWAKQHLKAELDAPAHLVPSTDGFIAMALAGLGWSVQPLAFASEHVKAGRLVNLRPKAYLDIELYWTATRLHSATLGRLTDAVLAAANLGLVGR